MEKLRSREMRDSSRVIEEGLVEPGPESRSPDSEASALPFWRRRKTKLDWALCQGPCRRSHSQAALRVPCLFLAWTFNDSDLQQPFPLFSFAFEFLCVSGACFKGWYVKEMSFSSAVAEALERITMGEGPEKTIGFPPPKWPQCPRTASSSLLITANPRRYSSHNYKEIARKNLQGGLAISVGCLMYHCDDDQRSIFLMPLPFLSISTTSHPYISLNQTQTMNWKVPLDTRF